MILFTSVTAIASYVNSSIGIEQIVWHQ